MDFPGKDIRVFAVWEPVILTDWSAPSTAVLRKISNPLAIQFWDRNRLISRSLGERDQNSIVWDTILIYPKTAAWTQAPPEPVYRGGPVFDMIVPAREAIANALTGRVTSKAAAP